MLYVLSFAGLGIDSHNRRLANVYSRARIGCIELPGTRAGPPRGLAGAPCQVVSPVRSYLSADDEATLPPNVHVTDWLPVHRLGDAIDLAITHGGEGTVQTSCVQGWPFIGIPLQLEQRFNVQRCAPRVLTARHCR